MKLTLITHPDKTDSQPGIVDGEEVLVRGEDSPSLSTLLQQYVDDGPGAIRAEFDSDDYAINRYSKSDVSIEAPISHDARVFCLGGAYTSHLRERDRSLFRVPHHWMVPQTAIVGHKDLIKLPQRVSESVKPAVELGIVIGEGGSYIDEEAATEHIAGYTITNDVTARTDWPGPRGYKIMDTFSPVGPHIVTEDEIDSPLDLGLEIRQSGDVICKGSTAGHRFTISFMISFLSTVYELRTGDVISTGDPGGVADRLRPGTEITLEIEKIGTLSNTVEIE